MIQRNKKNNAKPEHLRTGNKFLYLAVFVFVSALMGPGLQAGGIDVRVDFELKKTSTGHLVDVSVTHVDNGLNNTAELEHPGNRGILSFVVYDGRSNLIQPLGIGKADPPRNKIFLKPNETFNDSRPSYSTDRGEFVFDFVTGTAWYGYLLEKGKTYRVIMVYRGWEKRGMGSAVKRR